MRFFSIILICVSLTGCAAAGVPYTFNPASKLWWSEALLEDQNRPLPAQNLIEEAIEIYKARNDEVGLADAYRMYARFLQSSSVDKWTKDYFFDKTVTHDNRFEKALEYWNRAINLYEKNSIYDRAANCYFNVAKLYFLVLNDKKMACENNTKSLQSYLKFREGNPDTKVGTGGFGSFEELIEAAKREVGCP